MDPRLGPVYLGKEDLTDAYMWLWVCLEDTPSVGFLIPRKTPTDEQLVGFHLSLPTGYVDIAPFFCLATETITDMANAATADRHRALPHPLEELADSPALNDRPPTMTDDKQWTLTSPEQRGHALAQVDVYLDNFISTCQCGPVERRQMIHHLFRSIDKVFRTNVYTDGLSKEPISMKKLRQGDTAWSTKKTVLGWELDTLEHHLRLTPKRKSKVRVALDAIPAAAHQVSLRKWGHLLGLLCSITPAVAGAQGMFTRLQHALRQARSRQVQI